MEFRQRPVLDGLAAFAPSVSQMPRKNLCVLVKRISEKNVVDQDHVVLSLT